LKRKCIGLLLVAAFLLVGSPAYAGNVEQVRQQANLHIADHYKISSFFQPSVTINNREYKFKADSSYDFSEIKGVKFQKKYTDMPAVCYESDNRGDYENGIYQFLGQTDQGETVTDVRFPLKASWGENIYMEDLTWVAAPWRNQSVIKWWYSYSGTELKVSQFDAELRQNPELAAEIDARIMISNIVQVREDNSKRIPISDFWDYTRAEPKCYSYPWHKYVHITIPPTTTTWGYGIGFVNRAGRLGYKSFPIAPFGLELEIPDYSITLDPGIEPENRINETTWWAEPGKKYTGTATIRIDAQGAVPPFTPPAAVKVRNALAELTGEGFTEETGKIFRLKADKEGEYKAQFEWTMPTNIRSMKLYGAVNTYQDSHIPKTISLDAHPEKDKGNNLAEATVRANVDDLSIRAPQRKYVGPAGSTVDIKPGVTNENRGKLAYKTLLSWRWKDEPGKWHDAEITLPYAETARAFSMSVPVPMTERKIVIAVNRNIATDPANANPPAEYDIDNNFDGASVREAIKPAKPPADYTDPSVPAEEITVMPEASCEDVIVTLERGGGASVWAGHRVELRVNVRRGTRTSAYGNTPGEITVTLMNPPNRYAVKTWTVSLKPGESKTLTYVIGPLSPGTQTWKAYASEARVEYHSYVLGGDIAATIPDCNPNNNTDTLTMNVRALPTLPGESDIQVELRG